jgi:uncharacterized protein with HEPN domain
MTEIERKYLADIAIAILHIENFVSGLSFQHYNQDYKTQSAVERQLSIIGEALNQLGKFNSQVEISNAKQIIGFRNRLVHAYDSLDNSIIWAVINRHLPVLKNEISRYTKI